MSQNPTSILGIAVRDLQRLNTVLITVARHGFGGLIARSPLLKLLGRAPELPEASEEMKATPAAVEELIETKAVKGRTEEAKPVAEAEKEVVRQLEERHFTIRYDSTGHSYESVFGDYLFGAKKVVVEDPYIRQPHL